VTFVGKFKQLSRVHAPKREFWGAFDSVPLIEWLNRKGRPAKDPVEQLIQLNGQLGTPLRDVAGEIRSLVGRYVRGAAVAKAPSVGEITIYKWEVAWHVVGRMHKAQGQALIRLLHLAEQGLLSHIRQCAWKECRLWFFAKFEHQHFHSGRCQQRAAKSSPEFLEKHKNYMKRLRRQKKLLEARELERLKIKPQKRRGK
jgi:hypothetical protein